MHLNGLTESIAFYSKLLGAEPAKAAGAASASACACC